MITIDRTPAGLLLTPTGAAPDDHEGLWVEGYSDLMVETPRKVLTWKNCLRA